jgi:hypothetical protein
MFRIALFLLTLSTLTHGSPFLRKRDGLKAIPLERLGSVQDLSVKTIERSTRHSVERLHRSLDNYERNTGAPLSHAGSIAERFLLRKRAVYSDIHEELEPMSNGAWWSAKIDVGSPGYIRVNVLLDTGFTDVWLVSASCSKNCGTAPKVSQSVMSSLSDCLIIVYRQYIAPAGVQSEGTLNLTYHDDSHVFGKVYRDTIRVGDLQVENVAVGAADIVHDMKDIEG